ncbi:hypothetical protein ACH4U6_33385 [Streptomyces netropsis]|uniref:hypothetical protein n=1 Tax=Streptomyces netropsis TaxID=55404 RepID=UPI0037A5DF97
MTLTGKHVDFGAELSAASSACAGLLARIERAVQDREPVAGTDTAALTGLVQSVVHGLSVRANLGTAREDLLATARLAHELICRQLTSPTP